MGHPHKKPQASFYASAYVPFRGRRISKGGAPKCQSQRPEPEPRCQSRSQNARASQSQNARAKFQGWTLARGQSQRARCPSRAPKVGRPTQWDAPPPRVPSVRRRPYTAPLWRKPTATKRESRGNFLIFELIYWRKNSNKLFTSCLAEHGLQGCIVPLLARSPIWCGSSTCASGQTAEGEPSHRLCSATASRRLLLVKSFGSLFRIYR